MSIQVHIFLGFIKDNEINLHLNQSKLWKEKSTLGEQNLIVTAWQEKEYIGVMIPSYLTCTQIKEKENEIKTRLQLYCPKLNLEKHSAYLLSQLFIV